MADRPKIPKDWAHLGENPPAGRTRRWAASLWWVVVMLLLVWLWQSVADGVNVKTISYSEFKSYVADGSVTEVTVESDVVTGTINRPDPDLADGSAVDSQEAESFEFRAVRVEDPKLIEQLEAGDVKFIGKRPRFLSQVMWAWLLPIAVIVLIWVFIARRMSRAVAGQAGQALSFGKSKAKLVAQADTGVTFEDVAGCDDAKLELQEVIEFLGDPKRYESLGAKIPKGVLLVGPPGTGKTLLARAVAGESKVPFYSLSGSDFVEMFAGVGAARVRDLFEQAQANAPCIIFVDEIDAIGRRRGVHLGVVNDEREQTLNQLLVEMDGFESNSGVILLSATNRPDVLDPALLRPGRFDRQVVLDAPDATGRHAILLVHARNKPLADDVDLEAIARATAGFSGADLANAVNEAALLAARRDATQIGQADLEEAFEKVVAGPERKSRRLSEAHKRRVAYHEVGHALVAYFSEHADPVHKISIVPRGHAALGYTLQLPTEDQLLMTRSELLDRLKGLLGGRAAEQIVLGEVSSGAENDLERATTIARQMVATLGMNERVGLAHCAQRDGRALLDGGGLMTQRDCSEQTAREIDEEVRKLLDEANREAKRTLADHRECLDRVAAALLERETLDREAFELLVEPLGKDPALGVLATDPLDGKQVGGRSQIG